MEKKCSKCGEVKSVTEFYKQIASPDGLYRWCKACARIYQKVYYAKHREEIAARQEVYYKGHREERAVYSKVYYKVYYKRHREKIAARQKVYRDRHQKKLAIYRKVYREGHLEQFRMYATQHRVLKAGASGYATVEQIQARIDYYGKCCYICGAPYEHIDHVIPLSKGGSNWPANLRPTCSKCNLKKGSKWPYDFEKAKQEKETTY